MSGLGAAMADVVTRLRDATGLRVVDQLADVNPPCMWVLPPSGTFRFGRSCATVEWTAFLIATNAGTRHSVDSLGTLLDALTRADLPLIAWDRDTVQPLDAGDPHPALRLTWTATVPIGGTTP